MNYIKLHSKIILLFHLFKIQKYLNDYILIRQKLMSTIAIVVQIHTIDRQKLAFNG